MQLNLYQSKFKVVYSTIDIRAKKVKLTGFNKLNAHRYKHQATEQMAKVIKTDAEIKVKRLNDRKVQRLEAKLSKGKITLEEYRIGLAQL